MVVGVEGDEDHHHEEADEAHLVEEDARLLLEDVALAPVVVVASEAAEVDIEDDRDRPIAHLEEDAAEAHLAADPDLHYVVVEGKVEGRLHRHHVGEEVQVEADRLHRHVVIVQIVEAEVGVQGRSKNCFFFSR